MNEMRRLINVTESYHATIRNYAGNFEVFKNPSRPEFVKLLDSTQFGFVKAVITDADEFFCWDANLIHDLTPYDRAPIRLELSIDRPVWRHSDMTKMDKWEAGLMLLSNPVLQRLYPQNRDPKVYDESSGHWFVLSEYRRSRRYQTR